MATRSLIVLCLLFSSCSSQGSQQWLSSLTVDLTHAQKLSNNIYKLDNVIYNQSNYYIEESGKRIGSICNIKKCIRKCCDRNFYMNVTSSKCEKSKTGNFNFDVYNEKEKNDHINSNDFSIFFDNNLDNYCPEGFSSYYVDTGYGIFIQENGTLYYDTDDDWTALYNLEFYCVDLFNNSFSAFLCEPDEKKEDEIQRLINGIGLLISMPFLFMTFLVYAILPERNLHRKILMCYVICTFAANMSLSIVNFNNELPRVICHLMGYLIIYFYLGSFIWLNVICIDMWLAFSSSSGFLSKKTRQRKKLIIYSIYAWGVPICFVVMVLIINMQCDSKSYFHPGLGTTICFLQDGWPRFYFFYLPIVVLLTLNILLFVVTSVKIFKIKRETKVLKRTDSRRHTYENDKQTFNLYLKLLFAMGLNWITEVISWGVKMKTENKQAPIFYLTDFVNAVYGLLIFLIFVFKKKTWHDLQKRYYGCIGKQELSPSIWIRKPSASTRTRTSTCSTGSIVRATIEDDHAVNTSPSSFEETPLKQKQYK